MALEPANIIEGFEADIVAISEEFPQMYPDLKLSGWFKYWKSKSLNLIFANRLDPRDLLEAITAMNNHLVEVLTTDKYIVALYFLLSLSILQPERMRQRIRISFDDFIYLEKHVHDQADKGDAEFVWRHLKDREAIDVVECRSIYGPQTLVSKAGYAIIKSVSESTQANDPVQAAKSDALLFLRQKLEPALQEVINMLEPYEALKDSLDLAGVQDGTISSSIQLANDAIMRFKEM